MIESPFQPSAAVSDLALSNSETCALLRSPDYYAGLFDGEGCIGLYKQKSQGGYKVSASVKMCCRPVLLSFAARFGGKVVSGRPPSLRPNWTSPHLWQLQKRSVIHSFLLVIAPYLIEKRQQALTMLEYLERIEQHGVNSVDSGTYCLALKQQKKAA